MTKQAKEILRELDSFCSEGSPDYTEKFTALCQKMIDLGVVDAKFLSEAFQAVSSKANSDGYREGWSDAEFYKQD